MIPNEFKIYAIAIIAVGVIIGVPQMFKDNNSWWFIIFKFWLFLFPSAFVLMGIFAFLVGPVMAIIGLLDQQYSAITLLYIYVIVMFIIVEYIRIVKPEWRKKLDTI